MHTEPDIVERTEQPYVGMKRLITLQTFSEIADRLPEVFGWLGERGVETAGPPFFKYNVIDMTRQMEVEAGVPVAPAVEGDGRVFSGVLPAGRYATCIHVGHPDKLVHAADALLRWAAARGLAFDQAPSPHGDRWTCRLEELLSNPAEEPDMNKWETRLLFRLAG
jgi:effector-binding domain-containing protein